LFIEQTFDIVGCVMTREAGRASLDAALVQLDSAVDDLITLLGDGALAGSEATTLVEFAQGFERVRNKMALVDHRIVIEAQAGSVPELLCQGSMIRLLTSMLRLSPGEAARRVRAADAVGSRQSMTGEELAPLRPVLAAAQRAGNVTPEQVAVIERALSRVDHRGFDLENVAAGERLLTEFAITFGPKDLRALADRVADAIDPDGSVPDEQLQRDRRRFELRQTPDGGWHGEFRLTGEAGAKLNAVLTPLARPRPGGADSSAASDEAEDASLAPTRVRMHLADRRSHAQRLHDALEEVCDRVLRQAPEPAHGGVPATVIVTVDAGDLRDRAGHGVTSDGTVLTHEQVRRLADEAEVFEVRQDRRGVVLDLYRTRRLASRGQTIALFARDGGCSFPGCDRAPEYCERHHIVDWADGGETNLDNLTLLCSYHHHHFAGRGWTCRLNEDRLPEWRPPRWLDPRQRPLLNARIRQRLILPRPGPELACAS
jgi:hypothetical protein